MDDLIRRLKEMNLNLRIARWIVDNYHMAEQYRWN